MLKNPEFFNITVKEIQNKKVVGEQKVIETILLIQNIRNVINSSPTSSNLHINDESGIGKDYVAKAVFSILPKDKVVIRTKITPETFTYWHNAQWEPEWTWDGKIFYIEDVNNKIANSDVFKVFSSGGSHATVIIKQKAIDIKINGKPSMFITSYGTSPNTESLRRYPIINLDPSEEQTLAILERQSIEAQYGNENSYNPNIAQANEHLNRVEVVIPFAELLPTYFPKNIIIRTNYRRFLDMIKSSAAFYQYQREKTEDGKITAIWEDYDRAREIFLYMMQNPLTIPLTRNRQKILDFFKENSGEYAVSDIEHKFPISQEWLRKELTFLLGKGFLKTDKVNREGVKQKVTVYSLNTINFILDLPKSCTIDKNHPKDNIDKIVIFNKEENNTFTENTIDKCTIVSNESIELVFDEKTKNKKPLFEKICEVKSYVERIIGLGYNGVSYTALIDNFSEVLISKLIESGQLNKIPGTNNYTWEVLR